MTLTVDFKNEFSRRMLAFANCEPGVMYKCRFGSSKLALMMYRCVAAVISIIILVWSSLLSGDSSTLWFFTVWSFIMITLYFCLAAVVSSIHVYKDTRSTGAVITYRTQQNETELTEKYGSSDKTYGVTIAHSPSDIDQQMPWYMKMQWCVYNIALPSSFVVTIIYWGVLYTMKPVSIASVVGALNIGVHALNIVLMLIEQYVSTIPTRLLHVYQPVIYGVVYVVFSLILWSQTGAVLYPFVLDWNNPGITVGCLCGLIVFYIVSQLVLFLISRAMNRCTKY